MVSYKGTRGKGPSGSTQREFSCVVSLRERTVDTVMPVSLPGERRRGFFTKEMHAFFPTPNPPLLQTQNAHIHDTHHTPFFQIRDYHH